MGHNCEHSPQIPLRTEYMALKSLKMISQALQLPLIEYDERNLLLGISLALQEYLLSKKARIQYPVSNSLSQKKFITLDTEPEIRLGLCLMLSKLFCLINPAISASELNRRIIDVLEKIYSRCYELEPLITKKD